MTSLLAPPNSSIVYFTTASELQGLSFGECLAVDAGWSFGGMYCLQQDWKFVPTMRSLATFVRVSLLLLDNGKLSFW